MKLDLNSATAIITITGLGLVAFNKEKKRSEILFVHDDYHQFKLDIKPNTDDDPIISYNSLPNTAYNNQLTLNNLTVEVSGEGNCQTDSFSKYHDKTFNRKKINDEKDFRCIVNLERDVLAGKESKVIGNVNNYDYSKLFISNGHFYTYELTGKDFYKTTHDKDAKDEILDFVEFGKITQYIGVNINAYFVKLKITVGEAIHSHLLEKKSNPYVIEISNGAMNSDAPDSDVSTLMNFWETADTKYNDFFTRKGLNDWKGKIDVEKLKRLNDQLGDEGGATRVCIPIETDEPSILPFIS